MIDDFMDDDCDIEWFPLEHLFKRPSKEEWYMDIAKIVANRSECKRKKVGCVIVRDWLLVSTGFNWVARWEPDCSESGCCEESSEHCHTIHAEINAIINAARLWVSIKWASIFCTLRPCSECSRALINAWIEKLYYKYTWDKYENWHTIKIEDYIQTIKM